MPISATTPVVIPTTMYDKLFPDRVVITGGVGYPYSWADVKLRYYREVERDGKTVKEFAPEKDGTGRPFGVLEFHVSNLQSLAEARPEVKTALDAFLTAIQVAANDELDKRAAASAAALAAASAARAAKAIADGGTL